MDDDDACKTDPSLENTRHLVQCHDHLFDGQIWVLEEFGRWEDSLNQCNQRQNAQESGGNLAWGIDVIVNVAEEDKSNATRYRNWVSETIASCIHGEHWLAALGTKAANDLVNVLLAQIVEEI